MILVNDAFIDSIIASIYKSSLSLSRKTLTFKNQNLKGMAAPLGAVTMNLNCGK